MKKIETIWHHILWSALIKKQYRQTQKGLAQQFAYSLSTVHHALKVPVKIGAIRKDHWGFVLTDFKKLLFYWASVRGLEANMVYQTYVNLPVKELEAELPGEGIYGGYSAARFWFLESPADYDKVFYYFQDVELLKRRFPPNTRYPANLFILKTQNLENYRKIYHQEYTTLPHTFVDIWNLSDWYAQEFIKALQEKIDELLF